MAISTNLLRKLAVATLVLAFIISAIPAFVLASDAIEPGAIEQGAPATTSYNPTPDPQLTVDGGAALGTSEALPMAWATVLVAILGAVAWGVYRYSADTIG